MSRPGGSLRTGGPLLQPGCFDLEVIISQLSQLSEEACEACEAQSVDHPAMQQLVVWVSEIPCVV